MATFIASVIGLFVAVWLLTRLVGRETVFEFERALLYRNGVFQRILDPGAYWYITRRSTITKLDVRPRTVAISNQEILSADGLSVRFSLSITYAIADVHLALVSNQSFADALYAILQILLRDLVGERSLEDLLANRSTINQALQEQAVPQAEALGLKLLSVQIKDITLPGEVKKLLMQVIQAQKEGQAALEKARGETAALRNLANAAKLLEHNPTLVQLRALLAVGSSTGNSVVLHMPPTEEKRAT